MCDSPDSLQKICVDFIAENKNNVFNTIKGYNGNVLRYMFKDSNICLPSIVSDLLFSAVTEKINDQKLTIFDPTCTRLRRVCIPDATHLSRRGLRILRSHRITELTVMKLSCATVNDLIGCLGEWTLLNLQLLNVSHSTFGHNEKARVVIALSKLQNLRSLDVSFTEFNSQSLKIITCDLPSIERLNIAGTLVTDFTSLAKWCDTLKSLNLYNTKLSYTNEFLNVLSKLHNLQYLDISEDSEEPYFPPEVPQNTVDFVNVLEILNNLPKLVSLDLSGKKNIDIKKLKHFLMTHPKMQFLGLMENKACEEDIFTRYCDPMFNSQLVVTGFATEAQVLASLRSYIQRKTYVQKSLCYLYTDIQNLSDVRVDIIEIVIECMKSYPLILGIQMAATACFYILTKGKLSSKIHPNQLRKIVDCTLVSMENFPNQSQLQKNALLTLCSDRMLQDVSFNRYHCAELVMNSLMTFNDPAMNRMSVAICSILAARISTTETSNLGAKTDYMIRLLNIVKAKTAQRENDIMMKFTLSALWNLTDESPRTCRVFLDLGGLELFMDVLDDFSSESSVETKVLGLMNNIAEVSHLRQYLMKDVFVLKLSSLLHSTHIDVSYFAAGIVAHLASEGEEFWTSHIETDWNKMVSELGSAVLSWDIPGTEMVAYRSFNPFYPLFHCFKAFQVQLWAAWAVHHVCLKNPKRYCKMLVEENGVEAIKDLLVHPDFHESVANLCYKILHFVKEEFPNISTPERQESFL